MKENGHSTSSHPHPVSSFTGKKIYGVRRNLTYSSNAALRKFITSVAVEKDLHKKLVYPKHPYPFTGSFQGERCNRKTVKGFKS